MIATTAATAAIAAVAGISARFNWWRPKLRGLPVLMYHKIGDYPAGSERSMRKLWVRLQDFRWQLEHLKEHGHTPVHFSDWRQAELGKASLPERPVLISFDDGYANNYELAFPLLRELKIKAGIFLVYETIDRHNAWHDPATEPWVRMLTWSQLREMRDSGLVEFGSHTMRHKDLTRLPLEEARWEMTESKKRLEDKLGREVLGFAYPYGAGAYDPALRRLSAEAGYRYDFGIKQGVCALPWAPESGPIKRLLIRGDDTRLDFHLNLTRGRARL